MPSKIIKPVKYFVAVFGFILTTQTAWATPPSKITLSYDAENKTLHIDVAHVTTNVGDHYIRKLTVYKNDEEVETFRYPAQPTPSGFTEEVSLEAQPEDVIRVLAICNEAGRKEESLIIPVTPESPTEPQP